MRKYNILKISVNLIYKSKSDENLLFIVLPIVLLSCDPKPNDKSYPPKNEQADTIEKTGNPEPVNPIRTNLRDIENDPVDSKPLKLIPRSVTLSDGKSFELNLPEGFNIYPAAEGLRRVRFFAKAPDSRLFVTGMHSLSDNNKGKVFILDDFDIETKKFKKVITWKDKLRNPNSVQFYIDTNGQDWLYLALTDSLMRYKYKAGETSPSDTGQKIADFPGYGLNYKYGGWHLSRTIAFHNDKLYVSVGSSCNLCEEKVDEPSRAAILEMNPDGSQSRVYATGVRNAVDIGWIENKFYATNMAADHLGNLKPNDYFYELKEGKHYGWPYCYEFDGELFAEDPKNQSDNKAAGRLVKDDWERQSIDCSNVPKAYVLLSHTDLRLALNILDTIQSHLSYVIISWLGCMVP